MNDKKSDKTNIGVTPLSKREKAASISSPITDSDRTNMAADDKTRVRSAKKLSDVDVTNFIRPDQTERQERKPRNNPGTEDKTVIRKEDKTIIRQRKPTDSAHGKANVGNAKDDVPGAGQVGKNFTPDADELTRFNPKPSIPDDKTRIRQKTEEPRSQDELKHQSIVPDVSEYDVLKGRFVLEKVLGAGGMGVVYKAKDLLKVEAQDRDPYVAIKVLGEEFKSHPEAFISLQRESRKSQRIAHPNIVNVHDFDRDGDTVFMTMEYMEGAPLDTLIKQYKSTGLPTDDAWTIIDGISSALSHAHAENIVHSDFKPGNIFVTQKGLAKVFDFGISRAVAIAERATENPEDKTIFDAATLGALTPAYASLEMLEGQKPDVRDDVFALGCVAYEILTGEHPYNRVPADEAERQGLKPKRIQSIKKYQWKAIEGALALRREDRTETVDKFVHNLSPKIRTANRALSLAVLAVSIGITIYFAFFKVHTVDPYEEFNIRNELELKVRIDFYKDHLKNLLKDASFSDDWQDATWKDISDLLKLTQGEDEWVYDKKKQVYDMYLKRIDDGIKSFKLKYASGLLENARRYTDDQDELDLRADALKEAYAKVKSNESKHAEAAAKNIAANNQAQKEAAKNKKKFELFDLALSNVNMQLKCQGRLNMRDLESAVNRLREVDIKRFKKIEPRIIKSLGGCIKQMGEAFPERANEAKKFSLRIFKSNKFLANIVIKARDACDVSLAGLGARGRRAVCSDDLPNKIPGPELVVIPAKGNIRAFAIGKYETSIREINLYCKSSKRCSLITGRDESMPVSNISVQLAKGYLKWLSRETGQKYRLPTRSEWLYSANARRKRLDPNRNCKLSARGIEKGNNLVKADIGAKNDWGLVNSVGNVQEWVYGTGRKLVAVGGSYTTAMDSCNFNSMTSHSGNPDIITGFRVLREIRTN
jgi:serine/threonine protein kinase